MSWPWSGPRNDRPPPVSRRCPAALPQPCRGHGAVAVRMAVHGDAFRVAASNRGRAESRLRSRTAVAVLASEAARRNQAGLSPEHLGGDAIEPPRVNRLLYRPCPGVAKSAAGV